MIVFDVTVAVLVSKDDIELQVCLPFSLFERSCFNTSSFQNVNAESTKQLSESSLKDSSDAAIPDMDDGSTKEISESSLSGSPYMAMPDLDDESFLMSAARHLVRPRPLTQRQAIAAFALCVFASFLIREYLFHLFLNFSLLSLSVFLCMFVLHLFNPFYLFIANSTFDFNQNVCKSATWIPTIYGEGGISNSSLCSMYISSHLPLFHPPPTLPPVSLLSSSAALRSPPLPPVSIALSYRELISCTGTENSLAFVGRTCSLCY